MKTGERGGDDTGLGNLGIDTGKLWQVRTGVERAQRRKASRPDSAVGVDGRGLSGEEEAQFKRSRRSLAEEDATLGIDEAGRAVFKAGKQLAERGVQFIGSGCKTGGADCTAAR